MMAGQVKLKHLAKFQVESEKIKDRRNLTPTNQHKLTLAKFQVESEMVSDVADRCYM